MARRPVQKDIDKALAEDGVIEDMAPETSVPSYRVVGSSKIPVSKAMGRLWQSRKDQGLSARGNADDAWEEAIKYYEHNQKYARTSQRNSSGNTMFSQRLNEEWTATENIVFSNACIMLPLLYPKNPRLTFSYDDGAQEMRSRPIERVINRLIEMKDAPGLDAKSKLRKTILIALLTNAGYIKIGWTNREDASDTALRELQELATKLQSAKTPKEIIEIEGHIKALEEKVNMLGEAGPWMKVRLPQHIICDPTNTDGIPNNMWMMEWDYLPTSYLNAVYGTPNGRSVYNPTHVITNKTGQGDLNDEVNNFTLIKDGGENKPEVYGYVTTEQLEAACYTKVWWVWDKTTRRVYLFTDNDWTWPVWVWDDPLRLPRFFPYFKLSFHESPVNQNGKGEVTYYLDQQDEINEINDEMRRARRWARRNIFYNKNLISQDDVEQVLKGPDGTARGVDLEDGMKLDDAIMSLTPPSLKFPELFNTERALTAINRITGINDAQRGAQFKTNTTNQAIDYYTQNVEVRVDERRDLIEEFFADIGWNLSMLCLMNWDSADVGALLGPKYAEGWQMVQDPREFLINYQPQVEAGSTEKPNSKARRQEFLELAQILGQFANAAPATIVIMLKMMERAFPEVQITDEEWAMITETMMMGLQKAGTGPSGAQQQQEQGAKSADREQLKQQIASLPPEAQQQLMQLIEQGVPAAQALQQVSGQ